MPAVAATPPALGVVIVGDGTVTSHPAGIACPGKCTATFAAGTSVVLTPQAKNGSTFLRWGGACTGGGACTVKLSSLTVVGAQFTASTKTTPGPTPPKSVAVPGYYSGSGITFYVAPGGRSVVNISVPSTTLDCANDTSFPDHLGILQVAITPGGSFTSKTSQEGVFAGVGGTATYKFAGHFEAATATTAASAAGTWREDVALASGAPESCTTNDQSWSATRYQGPPQQKTVVKPGNYSGQGITFSVAPGGNSMLNISVPSTVLNCPNDTSAPDHIAILNVAVKPDGSFTSKTSETGVLAGSSGTFTYTFAGYFEGQTPAGAATVAGIWREDMVFSSGSTTMCTSDDHSWTAALQS